MKNQVTCDACRMVFVPEEHALVKAKTEDGKEVGVAECPRCGSIYLKIGDNKSKMYFPPMLEFLVRLLK